MLKLCVIILLLCGGAARGFAQQTPEKLRWTIEAPEGAEFDIKKGVTTATNGVVVRYGGAVLTAQKASMNENTGDVVAEGTVRLEREGQVWQSERLEYNFKTRRVVGENFRTGQPPFFVAGDVLVADQARNVYVGANGFVTTDDVADPGYRVRAKMLVIVPGEFIEAKHATLYLGDVPVFYFPYYRRSLRPSANNFAFTPGYRSRFGPYLLTDYNWFWNERLGGTLHLDARAKRGFAGGPDFNYHLPKFGEGIVKTYYAHDLEPGLDPLQAPIDDERYRIYFGHQATLRSNLTAKALIRFQSDPYVVRDFFESEYRRNVQPNSFFEINQLWPNYSLDVLAQPQVNEFFETVERLPEARLRALRQQIGSSPFFYESDNSAGYYRRSFADTSTNLPYAAFRADTFHQVLLPWTFFDFLNVTPRVGGRFTHYSEASGSGATTADENRGVFNTGAEVSFKASRVWQGARSRFWEIDGLRHIVQPSVNYAFVPRPSVRPRELPQFDYELPTTRLLPIQFPDYNAIDSIDSQNVLRLGLRNKLQTKRHGVVENLANWAIYTDWRLNPRAGQGTFSDLYSDLDLKPFSWLTLNSETRYDLNQGRLNEANHAATLTPNTVWSVTVGHRYLEQLPGFGPESGNNLIFSSIYYRWNENWGARVSHHFEARDGTMEEQYYTIYRDLRSLTAALTFRVRDDRVGPKDYTVALTMSLKAFPRFGLGDDSNQPSLLLGH